MTPEQAAAVARVREALAAVDAIKPMGTMLTREQQQDHVNETVVADIRYRAACDPDTIRAILAALDAAQAAAQAPREVPRLTNQDIADIGDERGLGTKILDAGYPCDMLWFDSNPTKFARAVESRVRELCGVMP